MRKSLKILMIFGCMGLSVPAAGAQLIDDDILTPVIDILEDVEDGVEDTLDGDIEEGLETIIEDGVVEGVEDVLTQDIVQDLTQDLTGNLTRELDSEILGDIDLTSLLDNVGELDTALLGADLVDTGALTDNLLKSDLLGGGLLAPVEPLLSSAAETADILPDALPVRQASGAVAFIEVEVENDWRAIDREWLLTVDVADLAVLGRMDVDILERAPLGAAGMEVVRVRVPEDRNSYAAMEAMLPGGDSFDRNHVYEAQKGPWSALSSGAARKPLYTGPVRIGMIDTAVARSHDAFTGRNIVMYDFVEPGVTRPVAHGTAIAGLFVGHGADGGGGEIEGLTPGATLYAASAFYQRNPYDQAATTISLVKAVDWLMQEDVSVINMSLAGPPNAVLEKVLNKARAQGIIIVAAVGNAGPASPPLYPAAYDGIIAVTAVDDAKQVYRWANRGNYLDFSAPGVSVPTVQATGGFGPESGTSIATAYVSAMLASQRAQGRDTASALSDLISHAVDLGEKGRDDVFGYGLVAENDF